MNAQELIEELSKLDPKTPIRFGYWDDYSEVGDVKEEVYAVSQDGWLNDTGDEDEYVRVHWCQKGEGHWDDEGVCSSHWTGEYIWWSRGNLANLPDKKEAPTLILWEKK